MQVYRYSAARQNLRQLIDKVVSDGETVKIVSRKCNVVVMSEVEYDKLIKGYK